jgi:hypothetical protein|tara:strand:+ start:176 stop:523 length:348 start_codon:yes stop_codon:yes gene_type:complete
MPEESAKISAKQITMILGLVTTIAGAVAGTLMMLYGAQIDNIREDNAADILRLESQIQRLDDDCDDSIRQLQAVCDGRLDDRDGRIESIREQLHDVKDLHREATTQLHECLSSND